MSKNYKRNKNVFITHKEIKGTTIKQKKDTILGIILGILWLIITSPYWLIFLMIAKLFNKSWAIKKITKFANWSDKYIMK